MFLCSEAWSVSKETKDKLFFQSHDFVYDLSSPTFSKLQKNFNDVVVVNLMHVPIDWKIQTNNNPGFSDLSRVQQKS